MNLLTLKQIYVHFYLFIYFYSHQYKDKLKDKSLALIQLMFESTIQKLKQDRKLQLIVAGSTFAAFLAFFALYKLRQGPNNKINEESDSENHEMNSKVLYEEGIVDKHQFHFVNYPVERNSNISDIFYKIILNLNKGNIYQGVLKLSFFIKSLSSYGKNFKLNYNGTSIKYVNVNGKVLDASEIQYDNHGIFFDKKNLHEKQINKIQIIFENKYSFLDDGLSSYFILDESNKYSLKQQVIFSKNGPFEIEKIIPCINVLNQCKMSLQIIYPEGFESFSNSPKSLERICTAQQYPNYEFFFAMPERGLNKSFKLNSSFNSSNFDSSTLNANTQTKRNSHFYITNLLSIHNLFVLCSNMVEIQSYSGINNQSKILVRYFGKYNKYDSISKHVATLNRHIIDICNRLADYKVEKVITKVDVFFIADRDVQGYFAPGAIVLDEQSIANGINIKTIYLVARAILGMVRLIDYKTNFFSQKIPSNSPLRNHLSLQSNLQLNEMIFEKFPECRGYLFFKQQDIEKARSLLAKKQIIDKYNLRYQQYFHKQSKFLLAENSLTKNMDKISFQFKDISEKLKTSDSIAYWNNFITQYNFLSPNVAQLLLKVSIKKKGVPLENQEIIQFAKKNFIKSKYYLEFFTNEQIQNNLPYFLQAKFPHLQSRLTQIKIKQKFREYITEEYEGYLPIKTNKQQAKSIYDQFKRFKENRNFHHISVLKKEVKRIQMFGEDFITKQKLNLDCGFMSWKLLNKIKIYPSNQDYRKIISELEQEPFVNDGSDKKEKKMKDYEQ